MELNKIMEENLSNFDRDGCLGYKKLEKYFYEKNNQKWGQVQTTAGKYYIFESDSKEADDADIFFSQLYPKFGIKTPVNFPVKDELTNKRFLVANDLAKDQKSRINRVLAPINVQITVEQEEMRGTTVLAQDFYHYLTEKYVRSKICDALDNCHPIFDFFTIRKLEKAYNKCVTNSGLTVLDPFFESASLKENPALKQFSREAVKKELKMKLLDVATFNSARLTSDYLYKTDSFLGVEDVFPLDSGNSWENAGHQIRGEYDYIERRFLSDFSYQLLTPNQILRELQENQAVQEYFNEDDRLEFAKQLRETTKIDIAKEVENKTNYKI